jgi:hypothetical protein
MEAKNMSGINRGLMQALQRYTPEYKEDLLSRAERTWRPQGTEDSGHDNDQSCPETDNDSLFTEETE